MATKYNIQALKNTLEFYNKLDSQLISLNLGHKNIEISNKFIFFIWSAGDTFLKEKETPVGRQYWFQNIDIGKKQAEEEEEKWMGEYETINKEYNLEKKTNS